MAVRHARAWLLRQCSSKTNGYLTATEQVPKVGIGVLILRREVHRNVKVLVGRRLSSLGHGTYGLPGGHLDFGETWEDCAAREVKEETGLSLVNIRFASVTNAIFSNGKLPSHYVTIFMEAEQSDPCAEPQNLEPEKCAGWEWVLWPNIPKPRFMSLENLIETGYAPDVS